GERQAGNPREVARAIVAVAGEAGLGFSADEHLRTEEICTELPGRACMVQSFVSVMVAMLAERFGGVRGLARAMVGEGETDLEPTVRRWGGLVESPLRQTGDRHSFAAPLAYYN